MNRFDTKQFRVCAVALLPLLGGAAAADEGPLQFSGSGFLTVAAGRIFGGDPPRDFNGYRAPIYVSDYAQGGVYERNGWTVKPDSKLGLQGTLAFNPQFSLTGQVVARGAGDGRIDLEWIYGSFQLDENLTLQLGRKRLPLFYYSETQDVGFSFPWTHLPPQFYGWEIVNYNGANLLWRSRWGDWAASMNLFGGAETRTDNGFWKIYNGRDTRTDSRWSCIVGADLTLSRDWFETRLAYVQSDIQNRFEDPATPPPHDYSPKARQRIYALAFAIDQRHWVIRNEYQYLDRKAVGERDWAQLLAVGYRFGKFLPMITYSNYRQGLAPDRADPAVIDPASIDPASHEAHATLAVGLRCDLTPSSAVKVQVEWWRDKGGPAFNNGVLYGNPRLFTLSYDLVF